jgi:surfeit locus 1 family protein
VERIVNRDSHVLLSDDSPLLLTRLPSTISCKRCDGHIVALLSGRRFAPSLIGTLLAVVGIASVGHLGFWQLSRAAEKRAILEQISAGAAQIRPLTAADADLPRYQTVKATGRYDTSHQILLDNMPSPRGMPGYRVLTPFALSGGGWLLVDRGWLPMGQSRSVLPKVAVADAERTIVGRLDDLPRPGLRLATDTGGEGWPRRMNFPERAEIERVLARPIAARILRLDPTQSDGYERTLAMPTDFGPNRHIAYAVQWFALAATMFVVYLLLSLKAKARHDEFESI